MRSGIRSSRHRAMALIVSGLSGWTASACHADSPPCGAPRETVRIAAVVDDLDLATEDGRTLKLAGLDPARPTPTHPDLGEAARRWLERKLVGQDAGIAILAPLADRWQRYPALVWAPTDIAASNHGSSPIGAVRKGEAVMSAGTLSAPVGTEETAVPSVPPPPSIGESLIAEGWARARPDAALASCVPAWLLVEDKARRAGLGLWADPYYAILGADDRRGLAERTGAMALVEGRLSAGESRGRLVFRLGGAGGMRANVTRDGSRSLARAGMDPHGLSGAKLRLRGFLDDRFGPTIDLTDARQIEILELKDPQTAEPSAMRPGARASSKDDAPAGP